MIYENIKALCENKAISISKLERDLNLARSSVCKWNENEPSVKKVASVANYLNVTIESLLKDNSTDRVL